jgi:2,3-bisphosphoglycerate-dependent phosphoglycerate mutase
MVLDMLPSPDAQPRLASADPLGEEAAGPALWLVRHGESTWNARGLAQGQSDQPRLTRRGARQAHYAARQLRGRPIDEVYVSDLRRAVATATPVAEVLGLDFTRDSRLRERGLGVLEGSRSVAVPAALSGVAGEQVIDPDARPPEGESLRDLYWRVAGFADDLLATAPPPREVAVVAHGGTLRVLTAYLTGIPVERMTWEPVANGSILRLRPHLPASC